MSPSKYDQDVATTTAIARACNNEVHQMTVDSPERFAGLATLPMQDIKAAIAELERSVVQPRPQRGDDQRPRQRPHL
jgi:aminocarboxymuconate-semialdehyde decarboxylase